MILNSIFLEGGNYGGIIIFFLLLLFGPPVLFSIIGLVLFKKNNRKVGKVFFIISGVYLIVGLGFCGAIT